MSGLNPLSGAGASAALTLGFPVEALQAQLAIGEILTATVLAPQSGQDLIEILGRQVVAQLPPGVHPGEVLVLQVTGFSASQVFVQNLGPADPQIAAPSASTEPPLPQAPAAPQQSAPISPPREVFVAASVRPAQNAAQSETLAAQQPSAQEVTRAANAVEARIAAVQAAKAAQIAQPAQTSQPEQVRAQSAAAQIETRANTAGSAAARVQSAMQATVQTASAAISRAVRSVGDLLKLARLPDTPLARTAAAVAPQAAARLPSVLARLEAALPRSSADPRVATLRTIAAFVGRMNVQSEETLAAQISSYVSHVVEGSEPKLAQLLQALEESQTPAPPEANAAPNAPAAAAPAPQAAPLQGAAHEQNAPPAPIMQSMAQARALERSVAIDHDLKSLVLSLLRDPPPGRTAALTQALSEALVTVTGAQINTLASNLQDPTALAFGLPVFFREGGQPANIRITRDSASGRQRLDADNFHIAFVLDTANLGMVAIDLQTTGRAVKVDVKTDQPASVPHFSNTLDGLRARLEQLRYRVSSAGAAAAGAARAVEPPVPPIPDSRSGLDMRA